LLATVSANRPEVKELAMENASVPAENLAALFKRVQEGDEIALAALVEQYGPVLRRVARSLLGPALRSHLDSLDLVQSVHRILLVCLREHKLELDSPEHLLGLALTLIRRRVARHWRQLKQEASRAADTTAGEQAVPARGDEADPTRKPQLTDEVERLFRTLNESDRHLLELRLLGYSTADVARQLGVDARVLRVRLGRLRKRLREDGLLDDRL
jgi:RNA polymerase sigma-70 factor (ECF subfamily)